MDGDSMVRLSMDFILNTWDASPIIFGALRCESFRNVVFLRTS